MKLIFCMECQDVVKASTNGEWRSCQCGESSARYIDELNAEYKGYCKPIGFNNSSLGAALQNQPKRGRGRNFEAFVIPENVRTFKKVE